MNSPSFIVASVLLLAALGCGDDPQSPTEPRRAPPPDMAAASALAFWQVSAGRGHTCGITTDYRVYCWGDNLFGQLGDGTTEQRLRPVAVGTRLRFRQLDAGNYSTCAVSTEYRLYCWGGLSPKDSVPRAVGGERRFRQVSTGLEHACAVGYEDRLAYCWGGNQFGQLGDGTSGYGYRYPPQPVAGRRRFRQVTVGERHTCGVTTGDVVFCWGSNRWGQIGDDSSPWVNVLQPSRIASARLFSQVAAGAFHTCAVSTDSRAFCWGNGKSGQIGDGKTYLRFTPRAVSGGLLFRRLTGSRYHTCGETTDNRAYCWGIGEYGELGDGAAGPGRYSLEPVRVAGRLYFKQLSAGYHYTCGKTTADVGYCWGYNAHGQLGDGTTTDRASPARVAGPT